ncbi:MAG TPA: cytochrome b5 domain-containing protein [Cyclobacteriaceae bacterium]|nr:cytochrome b5 domain-containing protein [Cyclobacteriaceae bacterium]HQQ96966.1 cytochrome b5 domain-containing protein [Cyclobacteriaceae bacterium]
MSELLPIISRTQLALRNGQDKPEIWIAFRGKVYDVTPSKMWRNGKHYEHWAGQDLTNELKDAPHNEEVFVKWKVIGKLAPDQHPL